MVPPSILSPVTRHAPLAAAILGGLRDVEEIFAKQLRSEFLVLGLRFEAKPEKFGGLNNG